MTRPKILPIYQGYAGSVGREGLCIHRNVYSTYSTSNNQHINRLNFLTAQCS